MKKIILSVFLLGTLVSVSAQVPSYVPTDSLKGWWPFNGNANDESGNGNNGTINGAGLTADRNNNANNAYSFNGSSFITIPHVSKLNFFPITMCAWVKGTSNYGGILTKYYGSSGNGYSIHFNAGHMSSYYYGNSLINCDGGKGNMINDDVWHFVVAIYNTSGVKLYVDNVLIHQESWPGTPSSCTTTTDMYVGKFNQPSGPSYFTGKIDDIGIWNRALTATEINDLYIGCQLSIFTEPTNQSSSINGSAQFNTLASDTTSSYQWQSNAADIGWNNLSNNTTYSGSSSKKLTVNNIKIKNHEQLFRVIATKNTCKDTSVVAMLTVNDTCITSTTDTLYIKVNTSNLNNPVYNTIKVYPNPSSTQVIIDNGNYSTMGSYTTKIVNSLGQQVFQSVINQQQFVIDAKTMGGAGVYTLYIIDANSKVVGVKKLVLQ